MSNAISPNTMLAHYTIVSEIGAGGIGEVYRAPDTGRDREVAIKILPAALSIDSERTLFFRRKVPQPGIKTD